MHKNDLFRIEVCAFLFENQDLNNLTFGLLDLNSDSEFLAANLTLFCN